MNGFAADRTSGSTDVALAFLDALERWLAVDRSASARELHAELLAWLRAAQAAQPSMALVHQFAARALAVADAALQRRDSAAALRQALAQSCAAERADLAQAVQAAALLAAELVPGRDAWIATLSYSGAVLAALRALAKAGRKPRVLLAESRPGLEGRTMAAALAAAGIESWLVADMALPMLLAQATAVWIGADAVTELGVLNKIGSFVLALAAREHGVPMWAIATRRKFLPAATPALAIAEMAPELIWDSPPALVRPRNVLFESVPTSLLRGIVVEDAVLGGTETVIVARDRTLPDVLAAAPVEPAR